MSGPLQVAYQMEDVARLAMGDLTESEVLPPAEHHEPLGLLRPALLAGAVVIAILALFQLFG